MKDNTTQSITKSVTQPDGGIYEITVSIEKWGPSQAKSFIEKMPPHQRNRKSWSVSRLSESMGSGQFWMNGDTFVFDSNGDAIDGQHRALAILNSGETIPVLVVRGVAPGSYISIDGDGVSKSAGDFFKVEGIKNYSAAAATAFLLNRYDNRSEKGVLKHTSLVTRPQIFHTYKDYDDLIQKYVTQFSDVVRFIGSRAVLTTCCVLIEKAYGEDFVEEFLKQLASGMSSCKAISSLHRAISADNNKPRKHMPSDVRFVSILEAARILRTQGAKVLIKPQIQKAVTL